MDLFSSPPHPGRLWGPPNRPPTGYHGAISLGVKQAGREVDHKPLSSNEVKNVWSHTSISPIRLHVVVLS